MMNSQCAIGMDVGGSSIKSGIVYDDRRLCELVTTTLIDPNGNAEHILGTMEDIIRHHLTQGSACTGVGFGFPNPFDYDSGISLLEHKFAAIYGLNIRDELRRRLADADLDIRFRNDAEAAILGETTYGSGKAYRRLIGITLGTGLGSSFVVDGVRVATGKGVPPDGWLWHVAVNEQQLADDLFSTRGLQAHLQRVTNAVLPLIPEAAAQARHGNAALRGAFAAFGADLGAFLRPYVETFEAEALIVLGGIANTFDLFAPAMQADLAVPLLPGKLGGTAGVVGAAMQLWGAG